MDYSLYNKVKEKFPPQPRKIIFVSLAPDNLEKLHGSAFEEERLLDLRALIDGHVKEATPFATIGGFEENKALLFFASGEFEQEEDLLTGEILLLTIETYGAPVDLKALKEEMRRLGAGMILSGNA